VRHSKGHDLKELEQVLNSVPYADQPTVVIADTVKGRGVSFMENVVKWHHGVPAASEFENALMELDQSELELVRCLA
jgi:transketolase